MKRVLQHQLFWLGLAVVLGVVIGRVLFKGEHLEDHAHPVEVGEKTIWTCSMHPQIRQEEPGKCPFAPWS